MEKQRAIKIEGHDLAQIFCPGCQMLHELRIAPDPKPWGFNGDYQKPTFTPSLLVRGTIPITDEEHKVLMGGGTITPRPFVCHSFIKDGQIQYLTDSTHSLAGQTVDLPEVPEW